MFATWLGSWPFTTIYRSSPRYFWKNLQQNVLQPKKSQKWELFRKKSKQFGLIVQKMLQNGLTFQFWKLNNLWFHGKTFAKKIGNKNTKSEKNKNKMWKKSGQWHRCWLFCTIKPFWFRINEKQIKIRFNKFLLIQHDSNKLIIARGGRGGLINKKILTGRSTNDFSTSVVDHFRKNF